MSDRRRSVATISVHAGAKPPASVTLPKVPPIYATSVFSFDYLDQIDEVYLGSARVRVFQDGQPKGIDLLEEAIAELEGREDAVAFASGMAAITTAVLATVSAKKTTCFQPGLCTAARTPSSTTTCPKEA